jgi:excisionase family DNA binding protein
MRLKTNRDSFVPMCVSVPEAGKMLGISRNTAYLMVRLGQLPVIRCGARRLIVPLPALHKMLYGQRDTISESGPPKSSRL